MSLAAHTYALDAARSHKLRPTDIAVLQTLADYANGATGDAWPSLSTLSRDLSGLHPANVRRALAHLVELGVIGESQRPGKVTVYRFPVADPALEVIPTPRGDARGQQDEPRAETRGGARGDARGPRAETRAYPRKNRERTAAAFDGQEHPAIVAERVAAAEREHAEPIATAMTADGWRGYVNRDEPGRGLMDQLSEGDPGEIVDSPLAIR